MRLIVGGHEYKDWVSASAEFRMDSLSDQFSFMATSKDAKPLPFVGGEPCEVVIDGEKVLRGFLEIVKADGDSKKHTISIQGRDITCDLLDSSIGDLADIQVSDKIYLHEIIETILKHLGSKLRVARNFNVSYMESENVFSSKSGENAFEFLEDIARRKQVFIVSTPEKDFDIEIIRASKEIVEGAFLQHVIEGPGSNNQNNNILSYTMSYDDTKRFNSYEVVNNSAPLASIFSILPVDVPSIVKNPAEPKPIIDKDIRPGRKLVVTGEYEGSPKDRAKWERNIRRARGTTFIATVHGYRNQANELWKTNTLVLVKSQYAGINEMMLVSSVKFTLDTDKGRLTRISLVDKLAYSIELEEPTKVTATDKASGKGGIFSDPIGKLRSALGL